MKTDDYLGSVGVIPYSVVGRAGGGWQRGETQ